MTTLASCPVCHDPIYEQDLLVHQVEIDGVAPDRAPELGDPVWSQHSNFRLSVRKANKNYACGGCGVLIKKDELHAGMPRSPIHLCLTSCAGFQQGAEMAQGRHQKEAA